MHNQQGFTLVELMIVIAIIATLSAIGLPGYQRYLDNAAMTDMLQVMSSYKSSVELCAMQGDIRQCQAGHQGIPDDLSSRYVARATVQDGIINLAGRQTLEGLTLIMTPSHHAGGLRWTRRCEATERGKHLIRPCLALFRFDDAEA